MEPTLALTSRVDARNWQKVADVARSKGFNAIDWNLDYFRIPAASNARSRFNRIADQAGVPSGFHGPCQDIEIGHIRPEVSEAARLYLMMYVDFLSHFKNTHMTLHMGSRSISMDEMDWKTGCYNLRAVSSYGKSKGVTVCIENLKGGWTSDPERIIELAEYADCGITLDLGHARGSAFIRDGRYDLEGFMEVVLPRLHSLHVYDIETPEGLHVAPATLDNIGKALRLALDNGVGWWVIELDKLDVCIRTKQLIRQAF